ncbi:MAG: acyl-CoA mutase large subunit family protein [Ectothiorhodospiraceae bacterium]|nr:acyl-CoA mutase large subunit family protein [Ectothiorhodospiraceae bacterium]
MSEHQEQKGSATVSQGDGKPGDAEAQRAWKERLTDLLGPDDRRTNRSGLEVRALYDPNDWDSSRYLEDLGYPGEPPFTRGIHTSMHRGRPWTPRLVVGYGIPEDYNKRMHHLYELGLTGLYVSPCNSHMRGYDPDQVEPVLLGTCGTLIATKEDMDLCLDGLPIDRESVALGDTAPYTLSALMFNVAKDRGIAWRTLAGTSTQSDYLSHCAALGMFFRIPLDAQRRALLDHVTWMNETAPRWNPMSVVGQHYQQAGATPAEAMGFALSAALQHGMDLVDRGADPEAFLARFSFFFDVSLSFFEEVAKFRAGRRVWSRLVRERFGVKSAQAKRLRFHVQTSGADLTRQQPLNNIARVTVQAMAGIFGGLQSLHTDAYDEAICSPTEQSARIAVATQHILRDEAHLADVIDPLGGSYYVERLTDEMEEQILSVIRIVDEAGGMFEAVRDGVVQSMIGRSALQHQRAIDSGEQVVVGLNRYVIPESEDGDEQVLQRPDPERIARYLDRLKHFRETRQQRPVQRALDELARAYESTDQNTYQAVIRAVAAGATHGEICGRVRETVGFGNPPVVV